MSSISKSTLLEIKNRLKPIIREILSEDNESPIVKNVTATEKFDNFVNKEENKGENFTESEFAALDGLDSKPYKKELNFIKYSATEPTSDKNKELHVIKKQNRYLAFFCFKSPEDISSDQEIPDDEDAEKDKIIIKVSRPFKSGNEDTSLLSNFINVITKEYNI